MRLSTIRNLTTEVITHRIIINVPFWMPWRNLTQKTKTDWSEE